MLYDGPRAGIPSSWWDELVPALTPIEEQKLPRLREEGSSVNLDLGPAFNRAQTVVNGLADIVQGLGISEGRPAGKADVPASTMIAEAIAQNSGSRRRQVDGE